MYGILTEFPHLTSDNFEICLASDDVLAHFFNDFLSLPSFSEGLHYSWEFGVFEVVCAEPGFVSTRSTVHCRKSQVLTGDSTMLNKRPPADNYYTVRQLDKEQGIQWIVKERLPFFLQSDCYVEYRLAKLLFQWCPNLCKQKKRSSSGQTTRNGVEGRTEWDKKNREMGGRGPGQDKVPDICFHCACWHENRRDLEEFKEFLRETPGQKLINFWIDIEKLKSIQHRVQKNRHLVRMRSRYLLSSSQSSLNAELLTRLGLSTSPCWTKEKLCSVQPCLTEALLYYWAPRFWISHCGQEDHGDTPNWGLWTEQCYSPLSEKQLHHDFLTLSPLCSDICLPQYSEIVHTQFYCSRSQLLSSRRMDKMLQALCYDSRAGLYFTHFCEQSGNQLWENAIYFWTDLKHYHELFYQDGMDYYKVQREAQVLYFTYLYSSARRSIGVDEKIRKEVYDRLVPAFEELFDKVEEHALNILLQPWTLLVSRDTESFQKVRVQEEVCRVEDQEYREPPSKEDECQLEQEDQCSSIPFFFPIPHSTSSFKSHSAPKSWSSAPTNYQSCRLGSLLRHRHEIGHFMSFLQNKDASIHLTCWLDLEQYRRTSQKVMAVKQERSSHITTKYLNKKYFFGPDSPASTEQQNDILRLAGGLERLKLECLSNPVVVEIQKIVRNHIEKKWLPKFLSTAEFTQRQKHRAKSEGLWMSSSTEILLFRQILLNPVTCLQFQHFVSLKGDFLENDVLFWLEVQRYKDLCHSHSEEATIQNKISTIINCFINSSMPPALQIDIPPEQAQHILEKRDMLGPYIFREAQMSVFCELLKFWPEFHKLSGSIQEDQLLPLLQEKRIKHRARVRRQRRKEEEEDERMRCQDELEAEKLSSAEDDDTDNDMDHTDEEKEKHKRTQSLQTSTQPLSWSYSKYMAALKREEVLLRRQCQLEESVSTSSDYSSTPSDKSAGSKCSHR
ncbi:regulator of G-protein signaling 22 [Channa argus]|uniref:regulator of G-protein signaling 22 n=1 Tax=Channa argus TaxID=215402 RepID=UPI003521900E